MPGIERSYGIGRPMGMIMREAPNAGEEAHRIWRKGEQKIAELPLSLDKEVDVEEAIRNSFAFVQIAGLKAGKSKNVANISTGLTWDRQTPIEDCAQEIIQSIGGNNAKFVWFGPHKLVGFVTGNGRPEDKLLRLVHAPIEPYAKYFPHLSKAQNEIQNRRLSDILVSADGTGRKFLDIFNGEEKEAERAYKDNNKYSFAWATQKIKDKLMGINLDNNPQSVTELARDEETRQMLEEMEKFFSGDSKDNRYFIEFDFSETVSCCNVSFNAQHQDSHVWDKDDFSAFASGMLKFPNGETYIGDTTCVSCLEKEENCKCKKDEKQKE